MYNLPFEFTPAELSTGSSLASTFSDHLPQFMIIPDVFCSPPSNKSNMF